jgi:Na+-driven multidrug efflux pump
MLLGVYFLLTKIKVLKISPSHFKFKKSTIGGIYKVGLPSIIMQSIGSLMSVGMNAILIGFSATAVAVFGIYFKLQSFIFMPLFGLSAAMISIVAYNYGAQDKKRIVATIKLTLLIAFCLMSLGTLLFQVFPVQLLRMFDASTDMLSIGTSALKIISLGFPLAAIGIVLSTSFQAMGKGSYSLMISIVRQLVIILPAAYLLSLSGIVNNIWYAFVISEGGAISMALILFARLYRTKIKVLENN